jgi:hypothetical protein
MERENEGVPSGVWHPICSDEVQVTFVQSASPIVIEGSGSPVPKLSPREKKLVIAL